MKKILLDIFSTNKNIIYVSSIIALFFAHWINIKIIFLILSIFCIISIFSFKKNCTNKEKSLYYFSLIFSIFTIIFVKYVIFLGTTINIDYVSEIFSDAFVNLERNNFRLILNFLTPFVITISFISLKKISLINIQKIALSFFLISTLTILLEFIGINFFNIPRNIIPSYNGHHTLIEPHYGVYIPFGLTANAAYNGGLILLSTILLNELKLINKKIVILFLISSLLTISGQVFFVNLIYINYIFLRNNELNISLNNRIIIILSFTFIFYLLGYSLMQQKLDVIYITNVIFNNLRLEDFFNLDLKYILFGQWGTNINNIKEATEVFYSYQIKEFGLLFSIFYYWIIYFLFKNTKYLFFNFFILFLSNLHYPVLLTFESWIVIIFIYFASNARFLKKMIIKNKSDY